jgi:hypothetical protein
MLGVCLAVNTSDVMELAARTLPSVPTRFEYPTTPALEFLRTQPGKFRVASVFNLETDWPTARANLLLPAGLDDPRVYESLVPANPALARGDWNALNVQFMVCPPGNVSPVSDWRLMYHGEVDIYENPHVEARVTFATEPSQSPSAAAQVAIEEYVSGQIRIMADIPAAGRLIVRERHYPGWQAVVDGQSAPIITAQGLWQSVKLSAGTHRVVLRYRPATVRWGAGISAVTVILIVLGVALQGKGNG